MLRAISKTSFLFSLITLSTPAFATTWYVDGKSGNDNNAGSSSAPFQTTWRGIQYAQPGDTVYILPTITYPQFGIFKSGTSTAPITIAGGNPGTTQLTSVQTDGTDFGIQINEGASYINLRNFNVVAPGNWSGIYVGFGSYHIKITSNAAHDCGLSGISTTGADYLTISGNLIYNNAHYTQNNVRGSGISTYENENSDNQTGIKNYITGNFIYGNTNQASSGDGYVDSDGNGIILDDLRHTQKSDPTSNVPYKGTTFVANNIIFANGGEGISISNSDHALVVNNTLYGNNRDPAESAWRPGEIGVYNGGDVSIYNNILYGDGSGGTANTGAHVVLSVENSTDGVGSITADYNLLYNLTNNSSLMFYLGQDPGHNNTNAVILNSHNFWNDPLFVNAIGGNVHVATNSPALNAGNTSVSPTNDFSNAPRSRTKPNVDIGAYQQSQ